MPTLFRNPIFFLLFFLLLNLTTSTHDNFTFNGFSNSNLTVDSFASITSNGLLYLTNATPHTQGHAFYPSPLHFKTSNSSGETLSFSTTFVFAILSEISFLSGNGFAFVISPSPHLSTAMENKYLGLFNLQNNGNFTNHIFAIEFDTILNIEFKDIDNNHVGIDINSLISNMSYTAGYYGDSTTGSFTNLSLISGKPMQAWVDFDGEDMQLNVTLSPMGMVKPNRPLLSSTINLTSLMMDGMYVGFSSSTGSLFSSHCILGWSFKMNGVAEALDYAKLPSLPRIKTKRNSIALAIWLPIALLLFLMLIIIATVLIARRRQTYAELLEDWELEYGPHRFSYKDLYTATKGFKDEELLGAGGFGRVYRGFLSAANIEVAVKKVSHESRQGMKEFVAEIVSIGQLRHRNLVQLLVYCRRRGELLLVYEFMPNGSLDRFLFHTMKPTLHWAQRFRIIKGVASGLLYLHEDWEKVVIHRDIKASNVLIDSELNGKLGDFGLARLYDHGTDAHTTHVVGTMGYLAPELIKSGKATTATDVFAFGAFLLEVVCGRRPIESHGLERDLLLKDWVLINWQQGSLLETRDRRLSEDYCATEVELVLKLGLLCLNPMPAARPRMRQVVQFLEGDMTLPELSQSYMSFTSLSLYTNEGLDDYTKLKAFSSSVASLSGVSGGR